MDSRHRRIPSNFSKTNDGPEHEVSLQLIEANSSKANHIYRTSDAKANRTSAEIDQSIFVLSMQFRAADDVHQRCEEAKIRFMDKLNRTDKVDHYVQLAAVSIHLDSNLEANFSRR